MSTHYVPDSINRGDVGTIAHKWADDTTDYVPVIALASPISGYVPLLAQPHDGGDFHIILATQQVKWLDLGAFK